MKTKKLKKSITVAFLLCAFIISGVSIAQNALKSNHLEIKQSGCTVTDQDVIDYLEGYGYTNIVPTQIGSPRAYACDFICDTDYSYDTYVTCSETAIIGHEDMQ